MARGDDAFSIRREYERRKEKEREEEARDAPAPGMVRGDNGQEVSKDFVEKLDEYLKRAEPLVLAVNASYNQWAMGVELMQPLERRNQLDQVMQTLAMMAKPTEAYRYRYQAVLGTYNTYRKRWDKMVQDVESGKIKRIAGPAARKANKVSGF